MLDIHNLMTDLSKHRPIFHSEADFQFALAWRIHEVIPDCEIRLEWPYRSERNRYLDIWLPTQGIAIELKYVTQQLQWKGNSEDFLLSKHSGHPQKRYDFLKDIQRLEWVVKDLGCKIGFAILLTNDPLLWDQKRSRKLNPVDADFHIYEVRKVTGELSWANHTKPGTKKGREQPIHLKGSYHLHWRNYSNLGKIEKYYLFRYLAVSVLL